MRAPALEHSTSATEAMLCERLSAKAQALDRVKSVSEATLLVACRNTGHREVIPHRYHRVVADPDRNLSSASSTSTLSAASDRSRSRQLFDTDAAARYLAAAMASATSGASRWIRRHP